MNEENTTQWLGPKPWTQCGDAEKIERLKVELDGWRRACAELRGRIDLLESHQHAADGKVMIDLQQADRVHRMNACASSFNTLA